MAPLQEILTNAITNSETGASEIEATMKKLQKIEYVKAKHVTASGEPRSIKQRSDGHWVGVCPGKYKFYGHSKEELCVTRESYRFALANRSPSHMTAMGSLPYAWLIKKEP